MKTKTTGLLAVLAFIAVNAYSQLNPVQNLQLQGFYGYPEYTWCPSYNCFEIWWDAPETVTDTLIGYRVYKNEVPWHFETQTFFGCMGLAPCQYGDIYDSLPCNIKVRAVYNSDSLESVANDSVYIESLAIGFGEHQKSEIRLLTNPILKGRMIELELPAFTAVNCLVSIVSPEGRIIMDRKSIPAFNSIVHVPSDQMNRGLYFIILETSNFKISRKLIIE